jgi:hypothetical protein
MLRDFFISPNFLALLRFWEGARAGRVVPDWNGDLAAIPTSLLARIIVIERREALIYRYLGILSKTRFGRDPTGITVAETLSPEYAAYVADLVETVLVAGEPVFSSSVLHQDNLIRRTGRLVARKHPVRAAARYSSSRYRRMMLGSALWMRTSSVRFSIPKSVKARVCSSPMP